jgi:hypothetical protein
MDSNSLPRRFRRHPTSRESDDWYFHSSDDGIYPIVLIEDDQPLLDFRDDPPDRNILEQAEQDGSFVDAADDIPDHISDHISGDRPWRYPR